MLHQSPDQKLYLTSISQILKMNYSYTKTQKFPPSSIYAQIPRLINMPFTPLSLGKKTCYVSIKKNNKQHRGECRKLYRGPFLQKPKRDNNKKKIVNKIMNSKS